MRSETGVGLYIIVCLFRVSWQTTAAAVPPALRAALVLSRVIISGGGDEWVCSLPYIILLFMCSLSKISTFDQSDRSAS